MNSRFQVQLENWKMGDPAHKLELHGCTNVAKGWGWGVGALGTSAPLGWKCRIFSNEAVTLASL